MGLPALLLPPAPAASGARAGLAGCAGPALGTGLTWGGAAAMALPKCSGVMGTAAPTAPGPAAVAGGPLRDFLA